MDYNNNGSLGLGPWLPGGYNVVSREDPRGSVNFLAQVPGFHKLFLCPVVGRRIRDTHGDVTGLEEPGCCLLGGVARRGL